MNIISIKENSDYKEIATKYIHSKWGYEGNYDLYQDSIFGCTTTKEPVPYWYLLEHEGKIAGCIGMIDHDFIDRTDLSPWLCSLFVEEEYRGQSCGSIMIAQIIKDAAKEGFERLYLCTDLDGYYEKYGFYHMTNGFYPGGDEAKIYAIDLIK